AGRAPCTRGSRSHSARRIRLRTPLPRTRATRTAARCSPAPGRAAAGTARTRVPRSRTPRACSRAVRVGQATAGVREVHLLERADARRPLELGRRAEGGEPAMIQHGNAIARLGLLDVMRRQEDREAGCGTQAADPFPQRAARARVE